MKKLLLGLVVSATMALAGIGFAQGKGGEGGAPGKTKAHTCKVCTAWAKGHKKGHCCASKACKCPCPAKKAKKGDKGAKCCCAEKA